MESWRRHGRIIVHALLWLQSLIPAKYHAWLIGQPIKQVESGVIPPRILDSTNQLINPQIRSSNEICMFKNVVLFLGG